MSFDYCNIMAANSLQAGVHISVKYLPREVKGCNVKRENTLRTALKVKISLTNSIKFVGDIKYNMCHKTSGKIRKIPF
jgi:hypothetical protein